MVTLGGRQVGVTHLEAICMRVCADHKGGDWKGEVAEAGKEDEEMTGTAREEETRRLVTERYG